VYTYGLDGTLQNSFIADSSGVAGLLVAGAAIPPNPPAGSDRSVAKNSFEPSIAVNPKDRNNIVVGYATASETAGSASCAYSTTVDGGRNWSHSIIEPGSKAENAELAAMLQGLDRHGSDWIERFDTLVMNSFLYPPDLVPGIQLADFVAGAADAALNRGEEYWWSCLAPYVRHKRDTPTRVLGYGLKLWPDQRPLMIGGIKIS